jgi:CxxC-x17-CxxC domain-containing protein
MGYYNRDEGRDRGRGGFGGRSGGGFRGRGGGFDRDRERPEMHDVVCDKCGKNCQVPFKPTGDKPVLCSDCYKLSGGSRGSSSGISSEQFNQINAKLDKIIKIMSDLELDVEDEEIEEAEEEVKKEAKENAKDNEEESEEAEE